MNHALKLLLALLLTTQASWACGVGLGPEVGLLVLGVLVVAAIPALVAPLLGLVLARKRDQKFTLGAALSVPVGWATSLAASLFLGVPGYFAGLVASVGGQHVHRFQVSGGQRR